MDIAIQLKKRNLEMIDHRQHVLGGTYICLLYTSPSPRD